MGDIEITVKTNFKTTLKIKKIFKTFQIILLMFIAAFCTSAEKGKILELFSNVKSVEKVLPKIGAENTRENLRSI